MGWWNAARSGASLQMEETGLLWGDSPADVMDDAIAEIRMRFCEEVGREPTIGEIRAGVEFSLGSGTRSDETSASDLDAVH